MIRQEWDIIYAITVGELDRILEKFTSIVNIFNLTIFAAYWG